jgi:ADP-heptose:LPS heptosyltransferase
MRLLDRWVGVPMSAMMTIVCRLEDLLRRNHTDSPRRVLIIKLVEQGATVVAEPALRRLVERVGRDNVYMAVFEENRFILDTLDILPQDNIISLHNDSLLSVAVTTMRACWRTRRLKIDTVIDFEFFSRFSAMLAYLSGARRRVGFHSYAGEAGYRGNLMTHRVAYNITLHASQIYDSLVEAAFLPAAELPAIRLPRTDAAKLPRFKPGKRDLEEVRELLGDVFGVESLPPLVLLNANSGDLLPLRRWETSRYVDLAQRLLKDYPDVYIALTGAPDERAGAEALASEIGSPRCRSTAGRTTLPQLLALYELAEVLLTNDSGPAHFASLTSIDVVALFGPETPAVFGALTPRSHNLWAGLACSPCVNAFNQRVTACTNNLCMQSLSVEQVYAAVRGAYDSRQEDSKLVNLAGAEPQDQPAAPAARQGTSK